MREDGYLVRAKIRKASILMRLKRFDELSPLVSEIMDAELHSERTKMRRDMMYLEYTLYVLKDGVSYKEAYGRAERSVAILGLEGDRALLEEFNRDSKRLCDWRQMVAGSCSAKLFDVHRPESPRSPRSTGRDSPLLQGRRRAP